jgi:rhodanese-related sulfurtransferase
VRTYQDLVAEAKSKIREVSPKDVMDMKRRGDAFTLVDVRDGNEVNLGMIPGAVHLSRGNLEKGIEGIARRDARVVLYCASGMRSALAAESLLRMGYTDVASMAGGIQGWVGSGGDVE